MGQLIKQFGRIKVNTPIPHLLTLQIDSYYKFLQEGVPAEERLPDVGLEGVFRTVFPIVDFNKTASLEFESYEIQEPKYDQAECISKGLTYEAPLRIKVRLVVYDVDESGERQLRDMKEQDIYFGTLPLMTEKGTFIVNGTERVIVNQLQRSPGIIFEHDGGKTHASRKLLYSCRIIPGRGSWLDFDFDHKDILYVRIDRRRKMPATILFKAMGMDKTAILDCFYPREERETYYFEAPETIRRGDTVYAPNALFMAVKPEWSTREALDDYIRKEPAYSDIYDLEGKQIGFAGKAITIRAWKKICSDLHAVEVRPETCDGMFFSDDVLDPNTGEVLAVAAEEVTAEVLDTLRNAGIKSFTVLHTKGTHTSSSIRDTLMQDKVTDTIKAQEEIYRRLRPSSPPTPEIATNFFANIFRNIDYYDLTPVGRYKINQRLGISEDEGSVVDENGVKSPCRTLTDSDILRAIRELCRLKDSNGAPDDIDHLGNRRVRLVGELVENQYRIGLVRMERAIKERMSSQELSTLMPHDLINPKPVAAVLKEFFGTSQLSQFMDQTNALSEVTHKRRLSALGPGGLTRERAGFEVRDVHTSHYGRICPIETPEGPNIGLIVSLTTFAKVNEFGFIETPYRVVRDCCKTDEIISLDATRETGEQVVAQANARVDEAGRLLDEFLTVRARGEVTVSPRENVTLMDVAPGQMVSISAALIPFLEHDDANRALMGSNMQRQAVPLLRSERPIVGTGMEVTVARDSGACIVAPADGVVQYADADRIVVSYEGDVFPKTSGVHAYDLLKYHKSNQNTCFGQKATCYPGQRVHKGDVLADGPGIDAGTLALGKNLTVAFMPWCGYNYEDAILISEKVVKEDIFTSIHIEEFEVVARDTKLGPEEITRDIPNVGDDMLHNLDDSGIIRIGASVKTDDILVGKVTPKGETQLTPEEKLLRAIFGEKARDVKNTSLKVPPGVEGTVIDVKVFNRRSGEKDARTHLIEEHEIAILDQKENDHIRILGNRFREKLAPVVLGKQVSQSLMHPKRTTEVLVDEGAALTEEQLAVLPVKKLANAFRSREVNDQVSLILDDYEKQLNVLKTLYDSKREKVTEGDDLPPGVIRMVKVYVAIKRKLSVGDKMAGRHGNKGVVSMILPEEDMPFFADGRPVDIVLNPLGVPSRMNIGQIMETHLGWGAKELGRQLAELLDSGAALDMVRREVKDVFQSADISEMVDGMDDEEFKAAVRKIRKGIITRTPVFDGATEEEIWGWMERAGLNNDGKTVLYDGRTGVPFKNRVTVGVMYMLKLHHLVDEKIHARSTGPYSLVTQQPLGGKAQFG
ncbi:MAG: DNA-directed RNA polymerase subunit beta, partial [Desulfovibrionaceae bacterium]|nr:DNA-directed RNA polymerase subunit beta [Desulfovibrionaceae bacterium]